MEPTQNERHEINMSSKSTPKPSLKLSLVNSELPETKHDKDCIELINFDAGFNHAHVLKNINLNFKNNSINCIVGPSGSGKSTLIRAINRINDEVDTYFSQGEIRINQNNILSKNTNLAELRKNVGMVFQKPCVFPKTIIENVCFGVQHHQKLTSLEKNDLCEENLKAVSLWNEVKHRLNDHAGFLSIGQQQRLCIARTLAIKPKVILLDEPTSALDPVSTRAIEDLLLKLKADYTIILVTHNIQQAKRIADEVIFICNGEVIEQGSKTDLFNSPKSDLTRKYLNEEYCDC